MTEVFYRGDRTSRRDRFGKIVGNPTNNGVNRLQEDHLLQYGEDLNRQIDTEDNPAFQHTLALEHSWLKYEETLAKRASRNRK